MYCILPSARVCTDHVMRFFCCLGAFVFFAVIFIGIFVFIMLLFIVVIVVNVAVVVLNKSPIWGIMLV